MIMLRSWRYCHKEGLDLKTKGQQQESRYEKKSRYEKSSRYGRLSSEEEVLENFQTGEIPDCFTCAISGDLMTDPVVNITMDSQTDYGNW
jgi:hypothetical protein